MWTCYFTALPLKLQYNKKLNQLQKQEYILPLAMSDYVRVVFSFVGVTAEMQNLVQRRIYPFLLMVVVLMGILSFQVRQFKRLYEHIKNDK